MSKVEPVANGLTLRAQVTPSMAQVTLYERAHADGFLKGLEQAMGLADAGSANCAARSGARVSYRVAPTRWLLCDTSGPEEVLMTTMQGVLRQTGAVMGFGAGRTVQRLHGRHARTVLAKACAIDLHPDVFRADHFAQTLVAHVACLVHRVGDADMYDLYAPRSYAQSMQEWLLDAAAEFSPTVIGAVGS